MTHGILATIAAHTNKYYTKEWRDRQREKERKKYRSLIGRVYDAISSKFFRRFLDGWKIFSPARKILLSRDIHAIGDRVSLRVPSSTKRRIYRAPKWAGRCANVRESRDTEVGDVQNPLPRLSLPRADGGLHFAVMPESFGTSEVSRPSNGESRGRAERSARPLNGSTGLSGLRCNRTL